TTLRKSLQKESQQINHSLQYKELYIENGIVLEANGKHLSLKETQALIIIKDQQLGSTILIDTKQYLILVLTQACSNCFQANQKWKIAKLELTVKYISKCQEYKSYMTFNNKAEGMNYTLAYTTARLFRGVTRHALQNILASFGITSQICEKTYNIYQNRLFLQIVDGAKKSAELALRQCIEFINLSENSEFSTQEIFDQNKDNLDTNFNYQVVKKFSIKFDTSWNHCRNANQRSKEDLDSNKTLGHIPIVNRVFADLKHVSKNIQKNLTGCCLKDPNEKTPTEEDLRYIQVEGLIKYLQNDHSDCWNKYHNNESYRTMMAKIRAFSENIDFSEEDYYNISLLENERSNQQAINIKKIHERNKQRATKYIANCKELAEFDFNQTTFVLIQLAAKKIFRYKQLRNGQLEAIYNYIDQQKDTLVLVKTGDNLQINLAKFSVIRGNILICQELQFEVYKKKDKETEIIKQLIDLIDKVKEGLIIIYCARKKDCDNLLDLLLQHLDLIILDIFYSKIQGETKKNTLCKWRKKKTRIMIATIAFGIGMDIDDIRL
ncbi:38114_t:CDS:2, partial [Gigaspora margarita]